MMKNKLNIISLISVIISILLIIFIVKLGILPGGYLSIAIIIIILVNLLGIILINKDKALKIVGIVILVLLFILSSIFIFYLSSTNNFFDKSFENAPNTYKTTYYVVCKKDSNYKKISDLKAKTISYYESEANIDKAITKLNNKVRINKNGYSDISLMFSDLSVDDTKVVLISEGAYNLLFDIDKNLSKDNYKVLYKFSVTSKMRLKQTSKDDVINIFVGGLDFTNTNMDLNMLITINTKSRKILLTSIPRDYYIEVDGYNGKKDTLSYMGALGIDTNVRSVEKLFGIKIDYYLSIKTNSLVSLVDEVGGINYCSEHEYTTTHAMILNSYNDSQGRRLHVKKGCQHLNGIETLTIARERKAFPGSDRQRQINCQNIVVDIFDSMKSINTITNYNKILTSVGNLYETNIPKKVTKNLIKETINNPNWEIESQVLDGDDTHDYVHMTNLIDWVMYPNIDSVNQAKEKIIEVSNK